MVWYMQFSSTGIHDKVAAVPSYLGCCVVCALHCLDGWLWSTESVCVLLSCTVLRFSDAWGNHFSGSIPASIGKLKKLSVL